MESSMKTLGLSDLATDIADGMAEHAALLRCEVHMLGNGARVIDCGVHVAGGYDAGVALSEICMGGLGNIALGPVAIGSESWPGLTVWTDHPMVSCMASQYAGWAISPEGFFAMGSGPLRAHARVEKELFGKLGYAETAEHGVLVLEGRQLPTEAVAEWVAAKAKLSPSQLTFLVAPTASLAGGVQIAARVVETAMHKIERLHFDLSKIVSAVGFAPLPPVAKNDLRAIGRTNDCILYGGSVHFTVRASDEELAELAPRVPASASRDYGTPFYDIFQRYNKDFYAIDPLLFSPAEVRLTSTESGRTFHAGQLNQDVLRASCYRAA
jgi:methenyltetrahydromethanopterin cyclohydrolase